MKANELTKYCLIILRKNNVIAWRNNTVGIWDASKQIYRKNPSTLKGVPDIIGFSKKDGRFISVEIKAGKDRLSQDQLLFKSFCDGSGAFWCLIRNLNDVKELESRLNAF